MRKMVKMMLAAVMLVAPVAASAVAVVGGDTRVRFSSAISGLTPGLIGSATIVGGTAEGLTVNFPITGGDLDASLAGAIEHAGSGVTLGNGTNTLSLSDFVIDTANSLLLGNVALNGTGLGTALPLFSFDLGSVTFAELTDLANPQLTLLITPTAAGALTTAFGVADLSGVSIGLAATAPELAVASVPEPASWALLITGFGAAGTALRLRRRVAAV